MVKRVPVEGECFGDDYDPLGSNWICLENAEKHYSFRRQKVVKDHITTKFKILIPKEYT
jgi:hypothetical protein